MSKSPTTTGEVEEGGRLPPVHPGEFLREDFMIPLGLTSDQIAADCYLDKATVDAVASEQAPVTAEIALRLARYFGTSVELWTGMQMQYDIETAEDALEAEIRKIVPRPLQAAE